MIVEYLYVQQVWVEYQLAELIFHGVFWSTELNRYEYRFDFGEILDQNQNYLKDI
jgi:hypothetical protein